ncbi:MAG: C40 family peptidase [Thermincolia bacterium]
MAIERGKILLKKRVSVFLLVFTMIFATASPVLAVTKSSDKQTKAGKTLTKKPSSTKKKVVRKKVSIKQPSEKVALSNKNGVSRGGSAVDISSPKEIDKIVSAGKELIGAPYRRGGTTPAGFDCSGFTLYVFKSVGINLPRTSEAQASVGTKLSREQLVPGALVYFNTDGSGISHVGIYLGDNMFIDSSNSKGVAINSLKDNYWGSRYLGATLVK